LPEISIDYDCDSRLDAPDIGADEYNNTMTTEECLVERIHTNEVLAAGIYSTQNNIYSQAIIESAVTYKAGNTISLEAGFHARVGSEFSANIESCDLPQTITDNLPTPNPTGSATTLYYEVAEPLMLTLDLYDVTGKKVRNILSNTSVSPGKYQQSVNVSDLKKGIYILIMKTQGKVVTEKIIIQ